jgi:4-diphosphocytidyl-2-C-methyl-D-erythritol kinase
MRMALLESFAPAKVNLTLRVLAQRADGLHELASIVAFADVGDTLNLEPGGEVLLQVDGPMAAAAGPNSENLVRKAAQAAQARIEGLRLGRFALTKRLPAGAGLGGGSSDAAAAIRLLAQANNLALDDARLLDAARAAGADVTVCLDPRARLMRGVGDVLSPPLELPVLDAVFAFPGVAVATSDVFRAHAAGHAECATHRAETEIPRGRAALIEFLVQEANDLEQAATSLAPAIAEARELLQRTNPRFVRMTGSGSAVFAIYDDAERAAASAERIRSQRAKWWVAAATLS